jgi:uncharacterized protein YqeY
MGLTDNINTQIKVAMVAKNKVELAALRAIKSELLLLATSKSTGNQEAEEIKILQRMVKQRKESAAIYIEQGRQDLADEEHAQQEIIQRFLPQQLSETEVRAALEQIIAKVGAASPSDMGKVMGVATKELTGKTNGQLIATLTKELLSK